VEAHVLSPNSGEMLVKTLYVSVDPYMRGPITDAAIPLLNRHARLSICGQISQYNLEKPEQGPRWLWDLIVKQARVEGFLVFQFFERFPQAAEEMAGWIRQGKLKYQEDIVEGFINLPRAFIGMLQGDNIGKRLV
jgi:NADPH-dependent curcumin reductase CurA